MSEKLSARNSVAVSPLRSNTLVGRAVNSNKPTSKRAAVKKTGEKILEERKIEAKNSREGCKDEFGSSPLNFTLVGSPAPRSQVRALVSSTIVAPKPKVKSSYSSKSREQHQHEICMEKLYQFADNPTKFVRSESRDEPRLKLDLEFSDRSEESDNFYDSHNIAFGENGEYRIPEYDHIRFLQFSIGESQDSRVTEVEDDSAVIKLDNSPAAYLSRSTKSAISGEAEQIKISTAPGGAEAPSGMQPADGGPDSSEEGVPQIMEINPWILDAGSATNWSKALPALDNVPNYPLGSAINYKNNINPEVEKFMFDIGETKKENVCLRLQSNRLLDESILSKNFTEAVRLKPFQGSVENSSRTSPSTSRTTLSQASSGDGTWHGHSLNSPYFASMESNSMTDSKRQIHVQEGERDSLKMAEVGYEETDEYLTIVKNEDDPTLTSGNGQVQKYIFITDQYPGSKLHSQSSSESTSSRHDADKLDKSSTLSSETDDDRSLTKMDLMPSAVTCRRQHEDDATGVCNTESLSDYCIGNIFPRSISSASSFSSSSSSMKNVQARISRTSSTAPEIKNEPKIVDPVEINSNLLTGSPDQDILYMTVEEVNLAADYTTKLSEIFNRVVARSKSDCSVNNINEPNVDLSSSAGLMSQDTSKLIYTCLGSHNFRTSHLSS